MNRSVLCLLVLGVGGLTTAAAEAPPPGSAYALPHNFYGAHLLVSDGKAGTSGDTHLRWARHLLGRWGHAKTLLGNIVNDSAGPEPEWIDYVKRCYELELIPLLRLAGRWENGRWVKPQADSPGDYTSLAQAVKRVVEGLPRSDLCPLYIELWNEPNLDVEWSGETNPQEYAAFFVQAARAVHSIGDDRIRILNGGLALSPEWTDKLCKADPEFIQAFDVWSSHPYPLNRPPWFNHHEKTVPPDSDFAIDAYLRELDVLRNLGRDRVKVMITETGYDLGNNVYSRSEDYPIIDEYNRADYMVRAFRDYWSKWPEVVAVFPFEFCNRGWERFDWVYPESEINPDGSPTRPHYQYTAVAALAKPTDTTGAISGTVTVAELGVRLDGAKVSVAGQSVETDPMGNFFFAKRKAGSYTVRITKDGFRPVERKVEVAAARNTVVDVELAATARAVLAGTVRSGDDAKPVAGAMVALEPGGLKATTNQAGQYVLKDCIPARYKLTAVADGRYRYEADHVSLAAGEANRHDFKLGQRPDLPPENLANNPSMEAGGGGGGKDWIALGFEPLAIDEELIKEVLGRVADGIAHTGRRCQAVRLFEKETAIRQITHYGTAKPGARYRGGIWISTDTSASGGAAWITFDCTSNDGGVISRLGPSEKIAGTKGWTWVSLEGVAPAGSQRLSLNLHTQGPGGIAYFDDAFIGVVAAAGK